MISIEKTVKEIELLSSATKLSRQALHVTKQVDKYKVIAALAVFEEQLGEVSTDYLQSVKKMVLLAIGAAKRFLQTNKTSEAKLVRRHSEAISKEFKRLSRIARRNEG